MVLVKVPRGLPERIGQLNWGAQGARFMPELPFVTVRDALNPSASRGAAPRQRRQGPAGAPSFAHPSRSAAQSITILGVRLGISRWIGEYLRGFPGQLNADFGYEKDKSFRCKKLPLWQPPKAVAWSQTDPDRG